MRTYSETMLGIPLKLLTESKNNFSKKFLSNKWITKEQNIIIIYNNKDYIICDINMNYRIVNRFVIRIL